MYKIEFTDEKIVNETGLAMIGEILEKTSIRKEINNKKRIKNSSEIVPTYDIIASYIGCLAQAKSEFARIEEYRNDKFYSKAMKLEKKVPPESTLRQRLDAIGVDDIEEFKNIVKMVNIELLTNGKVKLTKRKKEYIPVDIDVSPHDNSGTQKEGVEYTYKGYDGYAPIYAYIGNEGYLLNVELRSGSEHSQCQKTIPFLKETIEEAQKVVKDEKLLFTLDSGHSCTENIELFTDKGVDYIIKKNNGREKLEEIFEKAENRYKKGNKDVKKVQAREGKEYYICSVEKIKYLKDKEGKEKAHKVRIVQECIKRTIDKRGQVLIIAEYEIKQYYTSLELVVTDEEVIELYHNHAICEQFHSEIKTDMDLERFPSGKFNTNEVVLKLAELTFNILRMIGQASIELQEDGLKIKRKRIKTVIKDIVFLGSKIVKHARRELIKISENEIFKDTFKNLYEYFCYG